MKTTSIVLTLSLALVAMTGSAFAGAQQDKMKTCNAEAKTKALKGDERKAFMKSCLSNKAADTTASAGASVKGAAKDVAAGASSVAKDVAAGATAFGKDVAADAKTAAHEVKAAVTTPVAESKPAISPKERMKSCNAEAKTKALKGAERKAFMSTCLKAK